MFNVPNLSAYNDICNHKLPFNSHKVRSSFQVPLNLVHVNYIAKVLITNQIDIKFSNKLFTISKFYLRALQNCENDPEVAYLDLITAGEIISENFDYIKEDILDKQTLEYLDVIKSNIDNGDKIVKHFSGHFFQ